ncbi:peptidoglycan D,D-transpeptidase FtsI family protein [Rarobacter incanus]|uniref:Cell division protein FtsI (Penicillin-binding protein 3) n=1 Tax=Rarobacter incanus TaxID=153494 RepID=A0A542SLH8_9MICO|nr:penicillin-binding protein 2 [Rarobacter incanus]TQK75491.1 cell division protein FtsI (penicillin-binding protein 3) [Rarobacter incanus]
MVVASCLVLLLFIGRLVYIQGIDAAALAAEARKQITVTKTLSANRGSITDRNGVVLASSVTRYNVTVNQREIAKWSHTNAAGEKVGGPTEAARLTAELLDMSQTELAAIYTGDRMFKYVKKDVLPETWQAIASLRIDGIYSETTTKRTYPAGSVAGNIVGFVGSDGNGQAGIESAYNQQLTGTAGSITYERAFSGHVIPAGEQVTVDAQPGDTVELTIDRDIQYVAEQALADQIKAVGGSGGSVTVMNPTTGELYALAEYKSVDPNAPGKSDPADRGSKAVSDVFEPGSTAKVITMAALLETGLATPKSRYKVPDRYTTANGQTFKDSHDHPTAKWTLTGILSNSSNTGTVMAAEDLPLQVRYDYLHKFGFGELTGIELAGESRGILHPVDKWDGRTKSTVLFGQGVSVTALQAVDVFATIANSGKKVNPHLVKQVSGSKVTDDINTSGADTGAADEGTQVIKESVAKDLLKMLESTVIDGTGQAGAITGYRVAAKTGTAQAADASGQMNDIVASFIGVVPAEDPQLVISVVVNNPSEKVSIYGGAVAGPVFAKVGTYALQRLGIAPSTTKAKLYKEEW